ncbi:MAG: beta-propeller domain-containing protein, partial [Thermoanaerobaculales bacterium]|nr:beta-propeller domain-containing protein [Thermoanaerobaculales bacterium]
MNQLIHMRQIHQVITAVLLVVAATLPIASWANSVRNPEGRSHPSPEQSILHQVNDCADLRAFATESLVDSLLNLVFCSWDRPWNQPGGEGVGALDFTGTNNQEEGVDELDIIKTDGNFIYVARDDSVAILRSWPPERTEILSETPLDGFTSGIFLHGDRLAAISQLWSGIGGGSFQRGGTRIDLFDVEDRSQPLQVRSIEMEGFLVGSRLLDGKMYLVLHTWIPTPIAVWELLYRDDLDLPELDPSAPPEEIEETLELARQILTPLVAEIVAKMDISEILPLMTDTADESAEPTLLLQCTDILQPSVRDQYSVLSVVGIDLASGDWTTSPVDATAVLTSGWTVYASRNTLYVAQGSSWWWGPAFEVDGETTAIHSFDLGSGENDPVEYRASGEVPGRLPNQFSMSEYEGALRVASCHYPWAWGPETNESGTVVTVMRDNGAGFLQTIGQIGGIAPGENLYAARFLGERGYLVTFEIIDPLFTLDLTDPTEPRLTGELKIPGYSAYLHPMDHNHLLAIGMNGDDEGRL